MSSKDLSEKILKSTISEEELKETSDRIHQSIEKAIEDNRKYNEELLKLAKPKEELTVPLNCHVLSATENYRDVHLNTYHTGQLASLELTVDCYQYPELKKILFFGNPSIEIDDLLRAYVFLGEAKYLKDEPGLFDFSDNPIFSKEKEFKRNKPRQVYILRAIQEKELALKIEKIRGNRILKTYIDSSFKFP